jgi:hypothetical protein
MNNEGDTNIAIFEGGQIRKKFVEGKWFFSVVDVVGVLTESSRPRKYWNKLSQRLREEGNEMVTNCHQLKLGDKGSKLSDNCGQVEQERGGELLTNCRQLKMKSGDGKEYLTDCADTEGIFRIIQSIPSKRAEPFKRWLAKVGYERIQEIENPELAQKRMKKLYEKKGYSQDWINKRLRGIAVRQDLTDEWKKRGVRDSDFAILTAEISRATFGMTPTEYKNFKKLGNENLRDHMTDLELIFSMLGEASSAEIERAKNPASFVEHLKVSAKGGNIAKNALLELEKETGERVVSGDNYLQKKEKEIKKKKKLLEVTNE